MDRTEQLSKLNAILEFDKSWSSKINDIVWEFLLETQAIPCNQTQKIVQLNAKFMDQLSQIKNEIQSESLTQLFHPLNDRCMDLVQINYSSKNLSKEVTIPLGTSNFQNIIIIGDVEYQPNSPFTFHYCPLEMLNLTHKIIEVNEILFIYPEYELIIRDRLTIKGRSLRRMATIEVKAIKLDINPIFWCEGADYFREKSILIQFGNTTNPEEIRNRIVERTIKTLWSLYLQSNLQSNLQSIAEEILPHYSEIVWRRIHEIELDQQVVDLHGMPGAFDDYIIAFYDPKSEPGRIVNEVSKILPQWIPKHLLTHLYIYHMYEKTMPQIGSYFDSKQIIEVICCMDYLGGYHRDLVPMMFEIIIVL